MIENSPEFAITWLAVLKMGAVIACINHNLRGNSLLHCLKVATGKLCIFQDQSGDAVREVRNEIPDVECLSIGDNRLVWARSNW